MTANIAALKEMAGSKLDGDCVQALLNQVKTIENIQSIYSEDSLG